MRYLLALAALAELACHVFGQQFTVTNRCPPAFAVTNNVPHCADGKCPVGYQWQRWPGEDWKLVKVEATAPGVVVGQPFHRPVVGGGYHAGHACPNCGAAQFAVSGFNRDGTHNHVCPRCGTSWRH